MARLDFCWDAIGALALVTQRESQSDQLLSPAPQCEGVSTVRSRKPTVEPLNPDVLGAHILNDHAVRADARFAEIDLITDY